MPRLGVNIDHVATLRQARGGKLPDPVYAAFLAEQAGAQSIVAHLREDRRHIQDKDICLLSKKITTRLNLEMSIAPEILKIACKIKPYQSTLVPERRAELTTEGGLNVSGNLKSVSAAVKKLKKSAIQVSLFIDPEKKQVNAARKTSASIVEFHTGRYALAKNSRQAEKFFNQIHVTFTRTKSIFNEYFLTAWRQVIMLINILANFYFFEMIVICSHSISSLNF